MIYQVWLTVEDTPEKRPRLLGSGRGRFPHWQAVMTGRILSVNHWEQDK